MKKVTLLLVFCLFNTIRVFAGDTRNFNLILVIDDAVWVSYTNLKIEIRNSKGSLNQSINGLYYPGNLSFEKDDYENLLAAKGDSLTLVVNYIKQGMGKDKSQIIKLPFSLDWLGHYFMVMRIYTLDNKRYKGVFDPLDKDRNYTFELDYPGGQMLRVRHKVKKKQ